MKRKREIGETAASLLALSTGLLLLPIVAPVVMWKNVRGYADKYAGLPGIRAGGGILSGVAAFFYIAVLVSVVGGAAVAASGNDIGLDRTSQYGTTGSPVTTTAEPTTTPTPTLPPATDTESETTTDTDTPVPTLTATPTPTPTATPTPTPTPIPTATPTVTEASGPSEYELEVRRLNYPQFMDFYASIFNDTTNAEKVNYTLDLRNESATLTWTTNRHNMSRVNNEWQDAMVHYAGSANWFRDDEDVNAKMIPKRINFVTMTQEGELYRTSHISYDEAYRAEEDDSLSGGEYLLLYYYYAEKGPGHPDYEPNATETPAE